MKLLTYLALSIIFASCMLHGQQHAQDVTVIKKALVAKQLKEIDREKANAMHKFFANTRVKKTKPFYVEFDREELIAMLESSDQPTVKILAGAYMDDESSAKKLYPTILVQTAHSAAPSSKAAAAAINYRYFEGSRLCPPPSDCAPLEQ